MYYLGATFTQISDLECVYFIHSNIPYNLLKPLPYGWVDTMLLYDGHDHHPLLCSKADKIVPCQKNWAHRWYLMKPPSMEFSSHSRALQHGIKLDLIQFQGDAEPVESFTLGHVKSKLGNASQPLKWKLVHWTDASIELDHDDNSLVHTWNHSSVIAVQ